jgi:hypothetical protein
MPAKNSPDPSTERIVGRIRATTTTTSHGVASSARVPAGITIP